jgi:hypothetical protein
MNAHRNASLTIPTPEGYLFISQEEITYCESDGNYTTFYLREKQITCSKKLKELAPYLSAERVWLHFDVLFDENPPKASENKGFQRYHLEIHGKNGYTHIFIINSLKAPVFGEFMKICLHQNGVTPLATIDFDSMLR